MTARGLGTLEFARRAYDRWSRAAPLYAAFTWLIQGGRPLRARAREALRLRGGETVLDLACGTGANLAALSGAVGPAGRVIGLDYSPGMLAAARRRIERRGLASVELIEADAAQAPLEPDSLDAALCTLSLSAVPDHTAAIARVHEALRPGGRFAVLDAAPFSGALSPLNRVIRPLFERTTNWDPDADLPAELRAAFGACELHRFNAGTMFIALSVRVAATPAGDPA